MTKQRRIYKWELIGESETVREMSCRPMSETAWLHIGSLNRELDAAMTSSLWEHLRCDECLKPLYHHSNSLAK